MIKKFVSACAGFRKAHPEVSLFSRLFFRTSNVTPLFGVCLWAPFVVGAIPAAAMTLPSSPSQRHIAVFSRFGTNTAGLLVISALVELACVPVDVALQRFAASRPPGVYRHVRLVCVLLCSCPCCFSFHLSKGYEHSFHLF